jgi:CSLREA domain-containing protein
MFGKASLPPPRPSRGRRRPRWRPAVEQLEERAVPTAFTVNTLADENNPGDGLLSLREAITAANANSNPGPDVINFAAGLTGTINLTLFGADDTNAGGDLDILNPVSIEGPGANLLTVRQTVPNERVCDVRPGAGASVSISGLTISGGNGTNGGGGGVRMVGAVDLTLSAVEVTGNSSSTLNGGGGVLQLDTGSVLAIISSSIANNSTGDGLNGGGVRIVNGSALIINSTISGNTAGANGGGVSIASSGMVTIRNSTIWNNRAVGSTSGGGGIIIGSGATVKLSSTIVAGNVADFFADDIDNIVQASSDHNLIGDGAGLTGIMNGVNGNLVGTSAAPIDPLLGPLQLNGGHTRTHALLAGSPAIDKGFAPGEVTSDQRGSLFVRTFGAATDIGAFEVQPNPPSLPPSAAPPQVVAVAFRRKGVSRVRVKDAATGALRGLLTPFPGFAGRLALQLVDVNGDGALDLVVRAVIHGKRKKKIYDAVTLAPLPAVLPGRPFLRRGGQTGPTP